MPLELDPLRSSFQALADLLQASENDERMGRLDEVERNGIRAGVIQNFEITYELCWKFIARWLKTYVGPDVGDGVPRRELFRLAVEERLIPDVDLWMDYHEARNNTSHVYNAEKAEQVYRTAREFVHDARRLLEAMEARND